MPNAAQLASPSKTKWLGRNVVAIDMLSLFSNTGHELTTAIFPLYCRLSVVGQSPPGTIEGVSDAASGPLKMWMSHYSDRIGRRKPILVVGYLVTALMGSFAFVTSRRHLVMIRAIPWMSGSTATRPRRAVG